MVHVELPPATAAVAQRKPGVWSIPVDDNVVLVDDIKALKHAVHDEMERMGCGFYQRRTVAILGLGNVADAVEILAIGYILTVYEDTEGKISPWESSFLTAAVFAGMLAGGFFGGILGDIYGRKPVLLTTLAINAASAFLSAFSTSIYWLIFFRTLAGLGVGGVVSSLFALCLEHVPVSARGRYVTILCSFWMVGSVLTAATAWLMLGNDASGHRILDISWRWFAAVVGLPSFLCFLLTMWYVPESPHFLASQGKIQAVTEVLQYIHTLQESARRVQFQFTDAADKSETQKPTLGSLQQPEDRHQGRHAVARAVLDPERFRGIARLFHQPHVFGTLLLMFCAYCLSFGSYGLSTWITKLFQTVGLSNPFANAFLFAGANLPGNLVSIYLIDVVGRKQLLSAAFFSAATCTLLFAFEVEGSATIVVLVSCTFNACTTAAWNAFGVLSAETFPLEVRTTGISLVNCCGRIGAICAQFVNGFLVGPPPHIEALLLVVTSVMVAGGIASRNVRSASDDDAVGRATSPRANGHGHTKLQDEDDDDEDDDLKQKNADSRDEEIELELDDQDDTANEETRRCLRKTERSSSMSA
ncbi:Synaptic vesicle glycoprotein, partial [Globisporangium splendens]